MSLVIIGGSGFIGTKLIETLVPNFDILNLDKSISTTYQNLTRKVDVRDTQSLEKEIPANASAVILLAAEHRDDVSPLSLYYDVNVTGTANVLKVLSEKNIDKIVFTSSVAVYGLDKENPDETHPVDPFNDYGKSKWQAEELLRAWYNEKPTERTVIILRPTVVFGPKNKGNVYNLLKQIVSGKFVMIGNGQNKKSMSYVDNICAFMQYSLKKNFKGYHLYNYVDKEDLSMNDLVSVVEEHLSKRILPVRLPYAIGYMAGLVFDVARKITGKKFSVSSIRVKKFCATTQFSSDRMLSTAFVPPYSMPEALQTTINSIRAAENYPLATATIKSAKEAFSAAERPYEQVAV